MNPAEWLARTATRTPDAPALFLGTRVLASYAAFARRAACIGAALRDRGIGPGDRVAIFLPNSPDYLPILYGIWFAGAVAVPVNAKLHPREAAWIITHATARLAFLKDAAAIRAAGDMPDGISAVTPGTAGFAAMEACTPLDSPVPLATDDIVWLFYTSGTTGRPKGAMLSAGNLMAMSLSYLADVDAVTADDAALYAAPISHGAGLYNFIHVLRGARHVIPESGGFDPAEVLELARTLGQVSMFAAPTMVKRLVKAARETGADGTGLKTVVYGGGPMYVADIQEALAVFGPKFVQIYGQGESPMTISALSRADLANTGHPDWERRLASVGQAHSVAEIRIVDEDGCDLPRGEIGEIIVRGAQVMQGYRCDAQANAKSLRNGWLWTGDMGQLDAKGYLFLHDRAKDVVISGGSNIYPREVEEVLLTHPGIQEVSVVGAPDPEWGEIVVAFVVPGTDPAPGTAELDSVCTSAIARFKKPKRYIFLDALPKNNYGKILKTELRALLQDPGK